MGEIETLTLLAIKGTIFDLPEEERKVVFEISKSLQDLVDSSPLGMMQAVNELNAKALALVLVGATLAAKEE
jgi:hypothetical protein